MLSADWDLLVDKASSRVTSRQSSRLNHRPVDEEAPETGDAKPRTGRRIQQSTHQANGGERQQAS